MLVCFVARVAFIWQWTVFWKVGENQGKRHQQRSAGTGVEPRTTTTRTEGLWMWAAHLKHFAKWHPTVQINIIAEDTFSVFWNCLFSNIIRINSQSTISARYIVTGFLLSKPSQNNYDQKKPTRKEWGRMKEVQPDLMMFNLVKINSHNFKYMFNLLTNLFLLCMKT